MRSTQLATLRAIQAGADTFDGLAASLRTPLSYARSRALRLRRHGFVELKFEPHQLDWALLLTPKALSLLEARARLDGEAQ